MELQISLLLLLTTGALTDVETYTLTVNPVNDAPVLTPNGDESTDEDTNLTGISVIFTDIDGGDSHTITVDLMMPM